MLLRALVLGNFRGNGLRSFITLFAVALGVAIAYAIDLANTTAIASFAQSVDVISNHVNVQVFAVGRGFDERALLRVQRYPGVRSADPVVTGELAVGAAGPTSQAGEIVRVIGVDITRAVLPPGARAISGPQLDVGSFINDRGIIVSRRLADAYGLRVGGSLNAYAGAHRVRFRIDGIIPKDTAGVDSSVAFVDIATAQEAFESVGRLDRIDVIADPTALPKVLRGLRKVVPAGERVIEPRVRTNEIRRLLASFQLNLGALAYVALLVGMYLIYNAVAISVVQRKPEIGTLRALGARRRQLFAVFLAEGALFGVAGALLGLAGGALLARYSVSAVSHTVSTLYVGSHADGVVYGLVPTLKAFFSGVVLATVSAVVPALEAASTAPAIAMRAGGGYEHRIVGRSRVTALAGVALLAAAAIASRFPAIDGVPVLGYAAAILVIAGASLLVPLALGASVALLRAIKISYRPAFMLAISALRASQRRFAVAIASLMIAVGMMVAISILVGSFRTTVVAWANQTLGADLYVSTPGAVDASYHGHFSPADVARMARVRGVAAVDTYRGFEVPFRDRLVQLGATDFAAMATRGKLRFLGRVDVPALARRMRSSNAVAVSNPFEQRFALHVGDRLQLQTPSGVQTFSIAAAYNDYSTSEGTMLLDRRIYDRLFHDDSVDSIAIYAKPGVDPVVLRSRVERALAPLAINISTNREIRGYVIEIFNRTFAITDALYIISIAIAVLGVASTLFALVLERRAEIALLRYLGFTIANVRAMVYAQAVIVGLLAGIAGVVLGFTLSLILIFVIDRQSFGWLIELHVPWAFFGEAIAMVVTAALLAAIYPAGIAARIRTAEALRVE
ncbi:MAG: ABC transporter permease [Candidatus Eremiobacteraeota bacterium]|nr:ABC transporter permease [Candidatus Eremiobacteraeota bacterium]